MAYSVAAAQAWLQREIASGAQIAAGAIALASMGTPAVLSLTIPDGASAAVDFTGLPFALRVIDAWVVTTANPGVFANTMQLRTGADANVTDAISINGVGDAAVVRAASIDDANHEFAAGATMRVARVRLGGTAACIFNVKYLRVV